MQIAWKFDKETLKKIGKATFIAVQYGGAVALVAALQQLQVMDFGAITPVIGVLVPLALEVVRQWAKGAEEKLEK